MSISWIEVLQNFGLAVFLLIIIILALWRLFVWAGRKVDSWIEPLVKAHLEMISKLRDALDTLQQEMKLQGTAISHQAEAINRLLDKIKND